MEISLKDAFLQSAILGLAKGMKRKQKREGERIRRGAGRVAEGS